MTSKRIVFGTALLGVVLALVMAGCPSTPPSRQPALIVTPQSLDFGFTQSELTFTVSKVWTSRGLPPIRITSPVPWLTVSPQSSPSAGPQDPVRVVVTLNRDQLTQVSNSALLQVTAEGVEGATVSVTAQSALAAGFTADSTYSFINETIQFTDLSVVAQGEPAITSWLWDFGDGNTSTDQNPTHAYAQTGAYTVSLTIGNGETTKTFVRDEYISIVERQAPTADFSARNTTVSSGTPVRFQDLSFQGTARITSWLWDFGDGETSDEKNPVHEYPEDPGVYTVTLTVQTEHGSDTETKEDYIEVTDKPAVPTPPDASFVVSDDFAVAGQEIQFTDTSSPGSDPITSWFWDFGDGNTSTGQNPAHTYSVQSRTTFNVTLTVRNVVGRDSQVQVVEVAPEAVPPVAGFSFAGSETVSGDYQVLFTDESDPGTGEIVEWAWDFGDGSSSTDQDPTHVYEEGGADSYDVTLTVTTDEGTSDSATQTVEVGAPAEPPVAQFVGDPTTVASGGTVQFTDQSDPRGSAITSWQWDFGDGNTSTDQNPSHIYQIAAAYAYYNVSLTVTNAGGSDTEVKPEYITVTGSK